MPRGGRDRVTSASENAPPSLGMAAARGVFWTGGGQALRQAIQVVASIALARLLTPDDFGLLGMTLIFMGVAQLFADFGIGAAIVQSRQVDRIVLSSCFWANAGAAILVSLLLALASPFAGAFYGDPRVVPILLVLSSSLVLSGIIVVPRATLLRDMAFAQVAKAQVVGSLAGAVVAVMMAWLGLGVWSLVMQPIVGSAVTMVLVMAYAGWLPHLEFSWHRIRNLAGFSAGVLGSDLLNFANRNADNLLVGKFLGSGQLGYYSMAYQLMLYPLSQVSSVIVKVLFPALSRMQDDTLRLRQAYVRSISAIAFITFPMMIGLFAVSRDFVSVVFGEKWLAMLPVLDILCWVGMMQSIGTTLGTIYLSTGRIRTAFLLTLCSTPIFILSFVIGLRWGITGVALGYAIASAGLFYVGLRLAFAIVGLTFREFHRALAKPLAASVVMLAALLPLSHLLARATGLPAQGRLGVLVAMGVAVYGLVSMLINRKQMTELMAMVRTAVRD
jgi:PST family polysaccharide transporter